MAKNSGGTRVGTSKGFEWSHSDTYEDVLHDAQQIFKIKQMQVLAISCKENLKKFLMPNTKNC